MTAIPETRLMRSVEAEQSVLGGLLQDNSPFADVAAVLDRGAFSVPTYGLIFGAIADQVSAGKPADVITVFERLEAQGHAEQCGGLAHLHELAAAVPSASRAKRHAELVADFARRRSLVEIAEDMPALARLAESADAAVDEVQALIGGLVRTAGRGAPRRLGEVVHARIKSLQEVADGASVPAWPTRLTKLDLALNGGLRPGQVVVLAARPSVGKTSLAMQILLSVASAAHRSLMLSQEMSCDELAGRALAWQGSIRMDGLATGNLYDDEWARLPEAEAQLGELPVWVDDQGSLRLVDIAAKARAIKREHGLAVLVIDYVQLCNTEIKGKGGADNRSRHHQIEAISRGMKSLAKELGICVVLLSQLSRGAGDEEPELYHLKESGAIEEDADVVLLLHPREMVEGDQIVLCKVAKNRGGRRGRLALAFNGRTQRWKGSDVDVSRTGRRGGDE